MRKSALLSLAGLLGAGAFVIAVSTEVDAHGDVTPQAVDTSTLPSLGEDFVFENPWRESDNPAWAEAINVGASGYNQNCARCHGLEGISGGLAPDLRYVEADDSGDEWFLERVQAGYTQNGITKMPAFGEILSQEATWAIRTYIETRPEDGAVDPFADRLMEIRNELLSYTKGGVKPIDVVDKLDKMRAEMLQIASKIPTGSGAKVADSVASRAAAELDGSDRSIHDAAETLTIGLSAAQ